MSDPELKILCVDTDADFQKIFEEAVESCGLTALAMASPVEAIAAFKEQYRDVVMVISDFKMPEMTGLEFCKAISAEAYAIPFVM